MLMLSHLFSKLLQTRRRSLFKQKAFGPPAMVRQQKKMKSNFVSCIIGALSVATIILFTAPTMVLSVDPITAVKTVMSVLGPMASSYIANLRAKREAEKVDVRVWMHNGDTQLNGCGFYFQANGYSGGFGFEYFPKHTIHRCGDDKYRMRMTSQSANYGKKIRLGNEQVKAVELHVDGYHNTYINFMCFGFNEGTIAGGPQAICINNDVLQACKSLQNKWNDINIEWNDMMFTRTKRGAHKIILNNIEELVNAFETLKRNDNDLEALKKVCNNIDLVRGTHEDESWHCPSQRVWTSHEENEDKNPYGCQRYTYLIFF